MTFGRCLFATAQLVDIERSGAHFCLGQTPDPRWHHAIAAVLHSLHQCFVVTTIEPNRIRTVWCPLEAVTTDDPEVRLQIAQVIRLLRGRLAGEIAEVADLDKSITGFAAHPDGIHWVAITGSTMSHPGPGDTPVTINSRRGSSKKYIQ